MTWFLLKGLLRDRHRSFFPILIVVSGVTITILLHCFIRGQVGNVIQTNAKLDTGHLKIMTRAYADIASQLPNDLAITNVAQFLATLTQDYPDVDWAARIKFGGLLDIPDESGETRDQGPVFGLGIDLLSANSGEKERLNLQRALIQGHLPGAPGEMLISDQLAHNLHIAPGDNATLISATANGSMAVYNFTVAGTVRFGINALDRNAMLADIRDIQYALDMEDAAGEIVGFFRNSFYQERAAQEISRAFNAKFQNATDDFTPLMLALRDQNGLGEYLDMVNFWVFIYVFGFVFVMSIVLWNSGLMSGIRRYGEIGVRLAIGESKGHVYLSLIYESILIGVIGSIIGTAIGLGIAYYLQKTGLDFSRMMQGSTILMSTTVRPQVTPPSFYLGFIPGLGATTLGAVMSGIGIFKRQTSQLFKELEA